MKNRNIMSGIMCLHEILYETKRKRKLGWILKRHKIRLIGNCYLNAWKKEAFIASGVFG